jgi:hypothetical protein
MDGVMHLSPTGVKHVHCGEAWCRKKRRDTVGELKSAEMCVSHLPSWKAKKRGKLTQEKVLLEL